MLECTMLNVRLVQVELLTWMNKNKEILTHKKLCNLNGLIKEELVKKEILIV